MLLAIDVGNTNCTLAVFDGTRLMGQWRLATDPQRTSDEYMIALAQLLELDAISRKSITHCIISSVVPQTLFPLKQLSRKYFNCEPLVIGEAQVHVGINVIIDKPDEVGADRLVNALAARKQFGGNVVIIDFGTATTFDVVDKKGDYVGGVIAPGINLSMDALKIAAAKLPEIAVAKPSKVVGKSTIGAMQSGVYWGYVSLIEGIVARIQQEMGSPMKVVATGGLAALFADATPVIQHLERDLTIEGLRIIFEQNRK